MCRVPFVYSERTDCERDPNSVTPVVRITRQGLAGDPMMGSRCDQQTSNAEKPVEFPQCFADLAGRHWCQ